MAAKIWFLITTALFCKVESQCSYIQEAIDIPSFSSKEYAFANVPISTPIPRTLLSPMSLTTPCSCSLTTSPYFPSVCTSCYNTPCVCDSPCIFVTSCDFPSICSPCKSSAVSNTIKDISVENSLIDTQLKILDDMLDDINSLLVSNNLLNSGDYSPLTSIDICTSAGPNIYNNYFRERSLGSNLCNFFEDSSLCSSFLFDPNAGCIFNLKEVVKPLPYLYGCGQIKENACPYSSSITELRAVCSLPCSSNLFGGFEEIVAPTNLCCCDMNPFATKLISECSTFSSLPCQGKIDCN